MSSTLDVKYVVYDSVALKIKDACVFDKFDIDIWYNELIFSNHFILLTLILEALVIFVIVLSCRVLLPFMHHSTYYWSMVLTYHIIPKNVTVWECDTSELYFMQYSFRLSFVISFHCNWVCDLKTLSAFVMNIWTYI